MPGSYSLTDLSDPGSSSGSRQQLGGMTHSESCSRRQLILMSTFIVLIVAATIGITLGVALPGGGTPTTLSIEDLLKSVPLIDGHNDLPWQMLLRKQNQLADIDLNNWPEVHTDIPRLREGQVGGQFWALYISCSAQYKDAVRACLDQADVIHRFIEQYNGAFQLATTVEEIWAAFNASKVASLIGMEGGHCIDSSLGALRQFYRLGVRYMTITHNCNTPWADNSLMDTDSRENDTQVGLTSFGESIILEMNRLGMLVDLSHVSHMTMHSVLDITQAPVMFSHSSVYNLCPHNRNVQDDILLRTKENGGVVMVNFYNNFVTCSDNATLYDVADHIDYIKNLTGSSEYVGLGSDYDGVTRTPDGLEDVSKYPALFQQLRDRGWADDELRNLAGLNILRVMKKVEDVSKILTESMNTTEHLIPTADLVDFDCRSINGSGII